MKESTAVDAGVPAATSYLSFTNRETLNKKAERFFKPSQRHTPEEQHHHLHRYENLKSHKYHIFLLLKWHYKLMRPGTSCFQELYESYFWKYSVRL